MKSLSEFEENGPNPREDQSRKIFQTRLNRGMFQRRSSALGEKEDFKFGFCRKHESNEV